MPGQLNNARHELFARNLSRGMTQIDAYEAAGFPRNNGNASVLARKEGIKIRVSELMDDNRAKMVEAVSPSRAREIVADSHEELGLTKYWVLHELMENVKLAREAASFQASNKALELLGKEMGMFRDSPLSNDKNPHAAQPTAALPIKVMSALLLKLGLDPTDPSFEMPVLLPDIEDDLVEVTAAETVDDIMQAEAEDASPVSFVDLSSVPFL